MQGTSIWVWIAIIILFITAVSALGMVTPAFGFEVAQIQPAQTQQPETINWWDLGISIVKCLWYILF